MQYNSKHITWKLIRKAPNVYLNLNILFEICIFDIGLTSFRHHKDYTCK